MVVSVHALKAGAAAPDQCQCPEHSAFPCSFSFLFLQSGKGNEWSYFHHAALGSCTTIVLVKSEGRKSGGARDLGTGECGKGKSPEQKPCTPWGVFEEECENEERFWSWSGPTSFAHLQVVLQGCFVVNVVLVCKWSQAGSHAWLCPLARPQALLRVRAPHIDAFNCKRNKR